MPKDIPPCFYLFIYRKIKERANGRKVVPHFEVLEVMARNIPQVPKKYRYVILKEMETYVMIKKLDKRKIQIIGGNLDAKLERFSHPILE